MTIRYHGLGVHMRIISGGSVFVTDIMVEEDDFDRANDLLKSIRIE